MQALPQPITQDLVLIGGGHSHAIVLKRLGMRPLPGVRVTLISDVSHTPYSGMLPGYVAGFYDVDACHIDLQRLCRFAGATLILDRATGLDMQQNRVWLANHPPLQFDRLSIDIGSTPATATIPGAAAYSIPVKPISQFLVTWDQMVAEIAQQPDRPLRIAIVGGGAGGVELALSVQARLQSIYRAAGLTQTPLQLHILHRGARLIPERSAWVGKTLEQILTNRGVVLHLQESVSAIVAAEASARKICCESGLAVECDYIFWVTQAAAASWLAESGLATDERGFVLVNDRLQSLSHPQVFAAGDVATMANHPRPKAGVFAVRQGKALEQNLRRALQQQPLHPFVPQKEFLILIGTGDQRALASRGGLGVGPHALLWRWKDVIDRQFMRQFSELKPMQTPPTQPKSPASPAITSSAAMPCAGCGSKVGSPILEQVLARIQQEQPSPVRSDILIGLDGADDAAVVTVPAGQVMVQTVDHFRALVEDPFVFGQICANHCLSDLFAMAADPQSALAIVTLPYAADPQLREILYQLLSGAVQVLHQAGAVLVGGHTTEGRELTLGLTCNGLAAPEHLWRKAGMQPGQALILTKALGTGTLFAAEMQLQAKGRWIEAAVDSMRQSNQAAAACLRHQATACTDVTGFGLLGHLLEMIRASQVAVELDLAAVPVLPGAIETLHQGIVSSLHPQNLKGAQQIANLDRVQTHPLFPLLFDPQTSGGLLAAVPANQAESCVQALQELGYGYSCVIGRVLPLQESRPVVVVTPD